MHNLNVEHAAGVLQPGWRSVIGDYAIAGCWLNQGAEFVVADSAGDIYMFDGMSGERIWAPQRVHADGILALAGHPNGKTFATAGQDGRAIIWCSSQRQTDYDIAIGDGWVDNIAWSHDGQWLAASCGRYASIYDDSGKMAWKSHKHSSTISAIDWWSSQELVTASYGTVAFFDASSGDLRQQLNWRGSLVSIVLNPGLDIVACASQDNSVHFWRRSTAEDSTISGYPGKPSILAFNNAGNLLATTGSKNVTIWNFDGEGPEGTEPGVLAFHEEYLTTLAFSHGGKYLASGSRDGVIVVWLVQQNGNGYPIAISLVKGSVAALYWRQDDCALIALDAHGGVTSWNLEKK